ncbi:MAG: sensor histidine kinase [Planctomycetaceae bacterium]|nr:sensor histidine kinase [Planctomycetaceae bacterium]
MLLVIIVASLYLQDRRREWTLRSEQANHRVDVAFELISHELDRVRADVLFLADQSQVCEFVSGDLSRRDAIVAEYINFVEHKIAYDQIRLLDLQGRETIRINFADDRAVSVSESDLQNKSDRYYFRESRSLQSGEVFVSEFDLNLEHGEIDYPLTPVIRFLTPVLGADKTVQGYLVLNYRGARLLRELDDSSVPGYTLLLRPDGHYLRTPNEEDTWGWLLGHDRTFAVDFPDEWSNLQHGQEARLTPQGAFAVRKILMGKMTSDQGNVSSLNGSRDSIILVSYLPRELVFSISSDLLRQLLVLAVCIFIPIAILARVWAQATVTRELQSNRIVTSEERLRELSSRLLRIQEEERRAISREIHDDLGQQVTAISLDLKLADRNLPAGNAKPHLDCAIRDTEELLQTLHAFASRVRPAVLDDLGLRDAVESYLWDFQQRTNIDVDGTLAFQSSEVPGVVADNVYRLLQESLNNVAKHADATKVVVEMSTKRDRYFHLRVHDNGCGFAENESKGSRLGLVGMQERVDLLDGSLQMDSDCEQGTRVKITLPLMDRKLVE